LLRGEASLRAEVDAARDRWATTGLAEDGEMLQRLVRQLEALSQGNAGV
jgi:hypothetical protein